MIVNTTANPYVCSGQASFHFARALGQSGSGSGHDCSGAALGSEVVRGFEGDPSDVPSGDPSGVADDGPTDCESRLFLLFSV